MLMAGHVRLHSVVRPANPNRHSAVLHCCEAVSGCASEIAPCSTLMQRLMQTCMRPSLASITGSISAIMAEQLAEQARMKSALNSKHDERAVQLPSVPAG